MTLERATLLLTTISLLVLIGVLIPTLLQIRRTARRIEWLSDSLGQYLPGILNNVDAITGHLAGILSDMRENLGILREAAQGVKLVVEDVVDTERRIRQEIERPVVETVSNLQAILRAVRVFFDVLRGGDRR